MDKEKALIGLIYRLIINVERYGAIVNMYAVIMRLILYDLDICRSL